MRNKELQTAMMKITGLILTEIFPRTPSYMCLCLLLDCYYKPIQCKRVKNLYTLCVKVSLMSISHTFHITRTYCNRNFGRAHVVFLRKACRRTHVHTVFHVHMQMWINHRIIERFGLEGTLKIVSFQPPCHEQGHLPPAQGAQSPVQPGLEHCQGGGSHSFSGQPGPGPHHPHSEEFPSNI